MEKWSDGAMEKWSGKHLLPFVSRELCTPTVARELCSRELKSSGAKLPHNIEKLPHKIEKLPHNFESFAPPLFEKLPRSRQETDGVHHCFSSKTIVRSAIRM